MISLRRQNDKLVFIQLASFPGLSHIRLLHDDIVGCEMGDNVSLPHLFNRRTGVAYASEELPDENVSLFYIILSLRNFLTDLIRVAVWQCHSGLIILS